MKRYSIFSLLSNAISGHQDWPRLWRDPEPKLIMEGPIGLQLHSNNVPQEIHFKGLTLTTFPEDKLTTVK